MKVDPKRVEAEWNKRRRLGGFSEWYYLTVDTKRMLHEFVEACHEPVELTEEDARLINDSQTPLGEYRWEHLSASTRMRRLAIINAARRYTPPSLPTKLARAIEALGDGHPEAVRILKEAADAHG